MEGAFNMQRLKDTLLSLKKEIDSCLEQLDVDLMLKGADMRKAQQKGSSRTLKIRIGLTVKMTW
jgi:hypothetical protein